MNTADVLVRISANAQRFNTAVAGAGRSLHRFGVGARAEFARIRSYMGTMQGQMAGLGVGMGMGTLVMDSARLQKETQLLKVATGASREEMRGWNDEMYRNQQITGVGIDSQVELSKALQAAGLNMGSITPTLGAATRTMAVAETNADQLGKAMGVAAEQFDIDLHKPRAVSDLLDKMVVAGRAGNAELENLPDIFARVGGRAREANMDLDDTLAIVETLSKSEPQADRLATLVDSTLRTFTNMKYMQDASKGTGVDFFNRDGSRRDPLRVLQEMHERYKQLHSDVDRMRFINAAFGKADQDTQRGMKKLLDGDALNELGRIKGDLVNASGTVKKDMNDAIDNSVDQVSRLGGALRQTVNENFANPLNNAINRGIRYLLDPVHGSGGVGQDQDVRDIQAQTNQPRFSGGEIIAGGVGILAALYGAKRLGSGLLSKMAGGTLDIGKGVATGKALEHTAGVIPVYVVNMGEGAGMGAGKGLSGALETAGEVVSMSRWAKMGRFIKGAGVVGTVASVGTDVYQLASDHTSERDKAGAGGSIVGTASGALLGAVIGSIVPVIGTSMGAIAGGFLGGMAGEWLSQRTYDRQQTLHTQNVQQPSAIIGAAPSEFAAKWLQTGEQVAQQNANAVNTVMLAGTAQQQAVGNALMTQISSTQIRGNIGVTVSPSSELLNVSVRAVPGNANTQMTANVGRTGGPAS